jgi:ATP-dependent DNA helicase RecG
MKILGYVNRFNRGIARVQQELTENGNSKARFDVKNLTAFKVTVMNALSSEDTSEKNEEKDSEKNRKKTRVKTGVKTREKIINLIRNDNSITIEQLVAQTGLSRRGIEWNIDVLKKNGILERKGSKKTGIWMVNTVE